MWKVMCGYLFRGFAYEPAYVQAHVEEISQTSISQFLSLQIFNVSNEGEIFSEISNRYSLPCFTLKAQNIMNVGRRFSKILKYWWLRSFTLNRSNVNNVGLIIFKFERNIGYVRLC